MSFTDYLGTLGAKRVPVPYAISGGGRGQPFKPGALGYDGAIPVRTNRVGYELGASIPGLGGHQSRLFGEKGYGGQNYSSTEGAGYFPTGRYGNTQTYSTNRDSNPGYASGYVDSSGGFLGYGNSLADLQSNTALNNQYIQQQIDEPLRRANEEKQRLANEQAALNLQQRREAIRAATSNNPQFTGSGLVGMGQQGMAPQQMAPQQFGRAAVPGMGRGTGQGIGRGTGQGLLGGLHRGAAPTGGGQ